MPTGATPPGDEYVAQWYPPGADGVAITYCSDVDEFTSGLGVTASTDVSVRVTYKFREAAKPNDPAVGKAAANALREIVAQYARSCDGVEIIPRSAYLTPLPRYLVDAFAAEGDIAQAPPATVAVTSAPPETTSTAVVTTAAAADTPPDDSESSTPASGSSTKRIIGFVFLGLSILGLLWTLRRAGKERRVRPRMDLVRVIIITGTAIGMMIALANTPVWAVAGGVGLGLIVGWAQGRNVSVRFKGKRPYEKRNVIAIIAFAVGLVVAQGAGLLNRSGVIGIGVGISFLSAATAAGLLAGRRKLLGAARAAGPVSSVIAGLLIVSFLSAISVAVAQEEGDDEVRRAAVLDDLTAAVAWDEIEIRGGLFPFDQKPLTALPISPGLAEPPAAITRTVEWTAIPPQFDEETETVVDADPSVWRDYTVNETFSFSMTDEGVCCTVAYEGEGTQQIGVGEPIVMTGAGTLGDFLPIAGRGYSSFTEAGGQEWGLPFGEVEKFDSPTRETVCRRPVVDEQRNSAEDWVTTFNGEDGGGNPGPNFNMFTGCDVAGFDVQTARQMLPPVPPATAPERDVLFGSTTGTGCPVFQESFNALYDPSMGDAPTNDVRRMMLNPNSTACTADVTIGEEGPGGVRSEMHYEMAIPDPDTEAKRQYSAAEAQLNAIPAHEIDSLCDFDERGIAVAPQAPGEKCNLRTFHELGGGTITIWTDYSSSDGPNVIVRGDLPWGLYNYRCHHCDPSSPEVARIIVAMEVFGNTGLGNFRQELTGDRLGGCSRGLGRRDPGCEPSRRSRVARTAHRRPVRSRDHRRTDRDGGSDRLGGRRCCRGTSRRQGRRRQDGSGGRP